MTKRTTISIPDKLYKRMDKWKGEINFSKEFQRCIGERIDRIERYRNKVKGGKEMNEIVERLRSEMAESTEQLAEDSKNEGLLWAKSAHYDEIQFVLNWDPSLEPNRDFVEGLNLYKYFEDLFDDVPTLAFETDPYSKSWVTELTQEFLREWKEGVEDFWDEVKNRL